MDAAEAYLPHTNSRQMGPRRIPGWLDRIEPLRQKSLFWHGIWVDCKHPRSGVVADCMRRSRAIYHYAVRQVKGDEDSVVRERIAKALILMIRVAISGLRLSNFVPVKQVALG